MFARDPRLRSPSLASLGFAGIPLRGADEQKYLFAGSSHSVTIIAMKYSLRTLMIVVLLGPPLLAMLVYGWRQFIPRDQRFFIDTFLAAATLMTTMSGFYVYLDERDRLILVCSVACLIGLTVLIMDVLMP
jgi:hypothetical protein